MGESDLWRSAGEDRRLASMALPKVVGEQWLHTDSSLSVSRGDILFFKIECPCLRITMK